MYQWTHNEEVTAEEFIKRLIPLICDPVDEMMDYNGDLRMSDFNKLLEASQLLLNIKYKELEAVYWLIK